MADPMLTAPDYRFLDTADDRAGLIADIRAVRAAVLRLADTVPIDMQYTPRYHGWSLAAMLAHLHNADSAGLQFISFGLAGIPLAFPSGLLDPFNALTARFFRQREPAATRRAMLKMETRLAELIAQVPIDRLSKRVYHPLQGWLTAERALQAYFLFHWHEHYATMRAVEIGGNTPDDAPPADDAPGGERMSL